MKIITLRNSDWLDWHKSFLFIPRSVFISKKDPIEMDAISYQGEYRLCIMWLCFVKRRYTPHRTRKWLYWINKF